jgi:uncharacterized OsmC-like protein
MSEGGSAATYRVRARTASAGTAQVDAGSETITFDASWAAGASGLPGPGELLAAAFAACLLKNVQRASQLLPFGYRNAEVDVIAHRQDTPPRFAAITYELRLVTDESPHRVDLLHRNLRRYGTVYNTLAAACDVDGRVVALADTSTAPASPLSGPAGGSASLEEDIAPPESITYGWDDAPS